MSSQVTGVTDQPSLVSDAFVLSELGVVLAGVTQLLRNGSQHGTAAISAVQARLKLGSSSDTKRPAFRPWQPLGGAPAHTSLDKLLERSSMVALGATCLPLLHRSSEGASSASLLSLHNFSTAALTASRGLSQRLSQCVTTAPNAAGAASRGTMTRLLHNSSGNGHPSPSRLQWLRHNSSTAEGVLILSANAADTAAAATSPLHTSMVAVPRVAMLGDAEAEEAVAAVGSSTTLALLLESGSPVSGEGECACNNLIRPGARPAAALKLPTGGGDEEGCRCGVVSKVGFGGPGVSAAEPELLLRLWPWPW